MNTEDKAPTKGPPTSFKATKTVDDEIIRFEWTNMAADEKIVQVVFFCRDLLPYLSLRTV